MHDSTRAAESSAASGVRVNAGGILNIDGGSISKADYGVISWGTVHLKSGSVHDIDTGDARPFDIESVSMTMGGGEIYNSSGLVGSVLVVDGKLEMSGGSIHDCTGQGVWVYASGASMEMSDASIYAITKRGGRN